MVLGKILIGNGFDCRTGRKYLVGLPNRKPIVYLGFYLGLNVSRVGRIFTKFGEFDYLDY